MIKTSEYVSPGHPDKMCDFISSYILDRLLEVDALTRFALEVQAKDNTVNLAGEITTRAFPGELAARIGQWTRDAVAAIGYTAEYAKRWPGCAPWADTLVVNQFISHQSPEIANGVERGGWGDQGIFFGMAAADKSLDYMPADLALARRIGFNLYLMAKNGIMPIGLDIKTQVSLDTATGNVIEVIVAAPMFDADAAAVSAKLASFVGRIVADTTGQNYHPDIIINGTGNFTIHSTFADAGTTGRKLAVDFYGGNCPIGGGSPWTKDGSKADLALNIYARHLATQARFAGRAKDDAPIYSAISCCIGRKEIHCGVYEGFNGRVVSEWTEDLPADKIIDRLRLREPVYAFKSLHGLFKLPAPKLRNRYKLNCLGEI